MTQPFVVDTNVPIIANNIDEPCNAACVQKLVNIMTSDRVAIDAHHHILSEYRRHLNDQGQPGVGDRFLQWLYLRRSPEPDTSVQMFDIKPSGNSDKEGYATLPTCLGVIDPADQKFVCVYLVANAQGLLHAADDGWQYNAEILENQGILTIYPCD